MQPPRNLHQVDAALDAAYQRIQEVQWNLLGLRERRSFGMSPGHSGITLTGSSGSSQSSRPSSARLPLNQLGRSQRVMASSIDNPERIPPLVFTRAPSQNSQSRTLFRPLPDLSIRRSPSDPPHTHRLDEATTALGRRVAAREASRYATYPLSHQHFPPTIRLDQTSGWVPLRQDHEQRPFLERQRHDSTTGTDTVSSQSPMESVPPNLEDERRSVRSTRTQLSRGSNGSIMDSSASASRNSYSSNSERLSLLSNVSLRNFATPSSTQHTLFEEPTSFFPYESTTPEERDGDDSPADGRLQVDHRRLASDGDEAAQRINLHWDDEFPSNWLIIRDGFAQDSSQNLPSRVAADRVTSSPNHVLLAPQMLNNTPLPSEGTTRRRGWGTFHQNLQNGASAHALPTARLDADGDEIPMDEEEELERMRTEYRLRAQDRIRQLTEITQAPRFYSEVMLTDSPVDDTISPSRSFLQFRSNHDFRSSYGSVGDSIACIGDRVGKMQASNKPVQPYRPNPLPMPLGAMVEVPASNVPQCLHRTVPVSEYASFACR
ncbi:hypothetical protein AMATHDRAFT_264 [Amanita thiersii Skay4041]|uniref:Uncharacterized protein n=1 Tax=Amanita thiersii Skay4041 TaxID=703135 RepID=A0A2A9P1V1_9AGAR|nr:hypothetical protein AMATHDRAFT_264 [Amanita thiersii Skay4041]